MQHSANEYIACSQRYAVYGVQRFATRFSASTVPRNCCDAICPLDCLTASSPTTAIAWALCLPSATHSRTILVLSIRSICGNVNSFQEFHTQDQIKMVYSMMLRDVEQTMVDRLNKSFRSIKNSWA